MALKLNPDKVKRNGRNDNESLKEIKFRGEMKIKDYSFTQIPNVAFGDNRLNGNDFRVLSVLYRHSMKSLSPSHKGLLETSLNAENLMQESCVSINTFHTCINKLYSQGYIVDRVIRGTKKATTYFLYPHNKCKVEAPINKGSLDYNVYAAALEGQEIVEGQVIINNTQIKIMMRSLCILLMLLI